MTKIAFKTRRGDDFDVHFMLIDKGSSQHVVALDDEGRTLEVVAATNGIERDYESTSIVPQAGRFFSRDDSYDGTTVIADKLIMLGHMRVVGRVDTHYYTYAELEFDKQWLDELPAPTMLGDYDDVAENGIKVGYEYKHSHYSPAAIVRRGDWTWHVSRFNDDTWEISGWSRTNSDKHFSTDWELPLVDTWLEAMRLEKAMDEFVDMGNQIAEKYGVSFVNNLICHVAAGYWYLEG